MFQTHIASPPVHPGFSPRISINTKFPWLRTLSSEVTSPQFSNTLHTALTNGPNFTELWISSKIIYSLLIPKFIKASTIKPRAVDSQSVIPAS